MEYERLAAALSCAVASGTMPADIARDLRLWLPATALRLAVTVTTSELAFSSDLLQPGPFTLSVLPIADGSAQGACVAAGAPSVALHPTPQLCVPVAATPHVRLPGVPCARGCLVLGFEAPHASCVFRRTAALARALAETLPANAALLVDVVRRLLATSPCAELAQQYAVELETDDEDSASEASEATVLAGAEELWAGYGPSSSSSSSSGRSAEWVSSGSSGSRSVHSSGSPAWEETAAAACTSLPAEAGAPGPACSDRGGAALDEAFPDSAPPAAAGAACTSLGSAPADEIQPCALAASAAAALSGGPAQQCAAARRSDSHTDATSEEGLHGWPAESRADYMSRICSSDDELAREKAAAQRGGKGSDWRWHGVPRQSRLWLTFDDWRLEQLFRPWHSAACSQDDTAAVQVVAPLALLAGCCRPFLLAAAAPGPWLWAGHAALLLAYVAARTALALAPARMPAWRHHVLLVLWAVSAAHALRLAVATLRGGGLGGDSVGGRWSAALLASFRGSGLETLAGCVIVQRAQWALALPLLVAQALLSVRHLPHACVAASLPWLSRLPGGCRSAALAAHWLLMAVLPAVMLRVAEVAMRQRFLEQLRSSNAVPLASAGSDASGSGGEREAFAAACGGDGGSGARSEKSAALLKSALCAAE